MANPLAQSGYGTFQENWKSDLLSGFLVFLIALPLCLGIAKASGCPPIAGIITAIVGGILSSHLGSAPLTIKGPAAGLIAIVLGAVTELTPEGGDTAVGYKRMLAVGVVSALIQIVFAFVKAGKLADFFPSSVIHGMLAAIGVIIFSKQLYAVVGVVPTVKEPLELIAGMPEAIKHLNPPVALIGALALVILFGWLYIPATAKIKKLPAQMVVVLVSVPLATYFGFSHEHTIHFSGHDYTVAPSLLVKLPGQLLDAIVFPDFSAITSGASIKYIVMFCLIGSIESVASAKAVDALDPMRRRADMNKDLLAQGVGNLVSASLGGLPMISEIVRSSANIANGARSQWSNFFHGAFLLLAVALIPGLLQMIPLAALGGMLVYTGLRLASPKEFAHTLEIGREQLMIFVTTMVVTLATDLLVGVFAGIALKFFVHMTRGVPIAHFFTTTETQEVEGDTTTFRFESALIFSNYLNLKGKIQRTTTQRVVLDMSQTTLVDHTTMERLHDLQEELASQGRALVLAGLDKHEAVSGHKLAARRLSAAPAPGGSAA
ncbi:MAG: SulP family inorganic anion transporter [Polyangiales bacterium]